MPRNAVTIVQGRVYRVERVTRTYEGAEGRTFWCLSGDLATEQYATEAAALARFRRAERMAPTGPCEDCTDEGREPIAEAAVFYPEYRPSLTSRRADDHAALCLPCAERRLDMAINAFEQEAC